MSKKVAGVIAGISLIASAAFLLSRKTTQTISVTDSVTLASNGGIEPRAVPDEPSIIPKENSSAPKTTSGDQATVENRPDPGKFTRKLEPNLQQELLNTGFSQHEVDLAIKEMLSEWNKGNKVIEVAEAIDRIASILQLDTERKRNLNNAILKSIKNSSQITFDQWDACMRYRAQRLSSCANGFADDASRIVAEVSNQALEGSEWVKARDAIKPLIDDVASKCAIEREVVEGAFDIVVEKCP